jgi:hypothetical protein
MNNFYYVAVAVVNGSAAHVGPWRFLSFLILCMVSRTPRMGDKLLARPLPTDRTTQTHTNIHASNGI